MPEPLSKSLAYHLIQTTGGAIFCKKSRLEVISSNITSCEAQYGAALYSEDSNVTLSNVLFFDSKALIAEGILTPDLSLDF